MNSLMIRIIIYVEVQSILIICDMLRMWTNEVNACTLIYIILSTMLSVFIWRVTCNFVILSWTPFLYYQCTIHIFIFFVYIKIVYFSKIITLPACGTVVSACMT